MKSKRFFTLVFILIAVSFALSSSVVFAAPGDDANKTQFSLIEDQDKIANCTKNGDCFCQVSILIGQVTKFLLGLLGSIALVMFLYGGITWLISGGKTDLITKGKNIIVSAVLGIIIALGSYTIVNLLLLALVNSTSDELNYKTTATIYGQSWSQIQCGAPKPAQRAATPDTPQAQSECAQAGGACKNPQEATYPPATQACMDTADTNRITALTTADENKTTCDSGAGGNEVSLQGCEDVFVAAQDSAKLAYALEFANCSFGGGTISTPPPCAVNEQDRPELSGCSEDQICCIPLSFPGATEETTQ